MTNIKSIIEHAYHGNLSTELTSEAFEFIMSGEATDGQIGAFLVVLQKNGINKDHIIGALKVMHNKMIEVNVPKDSIDTCGTGGDGSGSLNVSTATSFVVAAAGTPIAKHGNKALTSNCGSADVLEALGIKLLSNPADLTKCINELNMCFMYAPNHHPAMKYVGKVRQEIGIRTIFNMLGPLLNPGNIKSQLVGVYSAEVQLIYNDVMLELGKENSTIVYGGDGMDEINITGDNKIQRPGKQIEVFKASSIGINDLNLNELNGGDSHYNANRIKEIFTNKKDAFYEIVLLNTAFALSLTKTDIFDLDIIKENYLIAKHTIDSGKALKTINNMIDFTQSY